VSPVSVLALTIAFGEQCSGLYQEDRVLLREGELQEVKRGSAVLDMSRTHSVYYCLFSDMLLRAEKKRTGLTQQWQVSAQIPIESLEFVAYDEGRTSIIHLLFGWAHAHSRSLSCRCDSARSRCTQAFVRDRRSIQAAVHCRRIVSRREAGLAGRLGVGGS